MITTYLILLSIVVAIIFGIITVYTSWKFSKIDFTTMEGFEEEKKISKFHQQAFIVVVVIIMFCTFGILSLGVH